MNGNSVGRIYRHRPSGLDRDEWFWTASGVIPSSGEIGSTSGNAATRAEAIAAMTAAYERGKAWSERTGHPFIRPPPPEWRPMSDP